ncbi:MAG: hypothetical protein OEV06_03720 [Anaerolineae bacterium]|nr:hypothetical protein [Anaerolineae bacterium]
MDTSLKRSLENWASRKALPRNGRRRLLAAARDLNRRRDGWRNLPLFRLLPEWLQTYIYENTWSWGSSESGQLAQALRLGESSYMTMLYIYGMRISAR